MANSVNKVILVGYLGKDPELRYTPGGKAVCSFSIATTEAWKDQSGEWQERTEWHRIVAWNRLGEYCAKFSKGTRAYVEGKMQTRKWQDRSGNDRYTTEVIAGQVVNLMPREKDAGQQGYTDTHSQVDDGQEGGYEDLSDVPF